MIVHLVDQARDLVLEDLHGDRIEGHHTVPSIVIPALCRDPGQPARCPSMKTGPRDKPGVTLCRAREKAKIISKLPREDEVQEAIHMGLPAVGYDNRTVELLDDRRA